MFGELDESLNTSRNCILFLLFFDSAMQHVGS